MSGAQLHVTLGEESYAVAVEHVLEVAKLREPTAVPGAPPSLLGVINHDGQVLPVVDLAALLGATTAGEPSCLLVVEEAGRRAGLAVDAIHDVRPAPELIQATESVLLSGAAFEDGRLVGMIELGSVLDETARRHGSGHDG